MVCTVETGSLSHIITHTGPSILVLCLGCSGIVCFGLGFVRRRQLNIAAATDSELIVQIKIALMTRCKMYI